MVLAVIFSGFENAYEQIYFYTRVYNLNIGVHQTIIFNKDLTYEIVDLLKYFLEDLTVKRFLKELKNIQI